MINRYALVLTAPVVLLSAGLAGQATASTTTRQAVRVPNPTVGNEVHKVGNYFGVPPEGVVQTVATAVDRGADFSAPTDYPQQRHVVYSPDQDTYMVFYEWNEGGDFMINSNYWQEVGGIGFWSFPGVPSDESQSDAGRPSAHEFDGGVMVAYHATTGGDYETWINTFDFGTQSWGTSTQITDGGGGHTFPFLDRSSDGTWFFVTQKGTGSLDITVNVSTDGVTWTEYVANSGVSDTWTMASGAADPSNGDMYIVYNNDQDDDGDGDVVIQRSSDGGQTWSTPQIAAFGEPGSQKVEPSMVVDRDHTVHIVFQHNTSETYDGGLVGFNEIGPSGPPEYVSGIFSGDSWIESSRSMLMDRNALVALPDSCEFNPTLETIATDSLTGIPQIGIYRGGDVDMLYVVYNSSYMSVVAEGGGWTICGPGFQTWMQSMQVGAAEGWSDRTMVSAISTEDAQAGRNSIYSHITHEVGEQGPGFAWSEMYDAAAPADVMFTRVTNTPVGIQGDGPGAPAVPSRTVLKQNAPNPFNPSTQISYELAEAGNVELAVYDAAGRKVRSLVSGSQPAGTKSVRWDGTTDQGTKVSSGVYFYRLTTANETLTRSMLIVK